MKKLILSIALSNLLLTGCASHQYDGMSMSDSVDGVKYSVENDTITVHYQEYQFYPNTKDVLIKCRKHSKDVVKKLGLLVKSFDYVTERNAALGITSCLSFGEIESSENEPTT